MATALAPRDEELQREYVERVKAVKKQYVKQTEKTVAYLKLLEVVFEFGGVREPIGECGVKELRRMAQDARERARVAEVNGRFFEFLAAALGEEGVERVAMLRANTLRKAALILKEKLT